MSSGQMIKQNPEPFYKIKPEYTSTNYKIKIKEMDKQYDDLGFGWFGHPSKKERQYSIFAYQVLFQKVLLPINKVVENIILDTMAV